MWKRYVSYMSNCRDVQLYLTLDQSKYHGFQFVQYPLILPWSIAVVSFRWDTSNTVTKTKHQENCISDPTDKQEELLHLDPDLDFLDCDHCQLDVRDADSLSEPPASALNSTDSGLAGQCGATDNVPFLPASQHDHARYVANVSPHSNSSIATNTDGSSDTNYSPDGTSIPKHRCIRWKLEDGSDNEFNFIVL